MSQREIRLIVAVLVALGGVVLLVVFAEHVMHAQNRIDNGMALVGALLSRR